ncbi:hypothetical protein CRUP_035532 [Coryphaenoides rupestris]|nr:hypothetical protein CRUP_035532 [Coryphaenoides rupestris]
MGGDGSGNSSLFLADGCTAGFLVVGHDPPRGPSHWTPPPHPPPPLPPPFDWRLLGYTSQEEVSASFPACDTEAPGKN